MSRILRPYQVESVDSIFEEWKTNKSTLLVLATGLGKTVVAAEVIRRSQPKRVMFLVHRDELATQAQSTIEPLGLECDFEIADQVADRRGLFQKSPVIISTVQTQYSGASGGRMTRFNPMDFGVLIVDEAHHYVSPSYRRVIEYYQQNPNLRTIGLTATPDRMDEKALGQIFQSVSNQYEILDGIKDGYLVPIEQQLVEIKTLDFSEVRTTAGDLNGADLAEIMEAEENVQGIASSSLDIIGNRRTLIFTASVRQAEMMANIFNRHKSGMAEWVSGSTPTENRKATLKRFASGEIQVVANCAVLGEGYDNPAVEVVIQAKPTESRSLYSQQIGRGTRPLPGVIDGLATAEERKFAIASSAKPRLLVVDHVGNSGKHKLMTSVDILGGKINEEVIQRATQLAKERGKARVVEVLEEARQQLIKEAEERDERRRQEEARKAKLIAKPTYTVKKIDPFNVLDLEPVAIRGWDADRKVSEKQAKILRMMGVDPYSVPFSRGCQLVGEFFRRKNANLCTVGQANVLKRFGYQVKNMTSAQAAEAFKELKANNWKRPKPPQNPPAQAT